MVSCSGCNWAIREQSGSTNVSDCGGGGDWRLDNDGGAAWDPSQGQATESGVDQPQKDTEVQNATLL
jgi:hypothetical protein